MNIFLPALILIEAGVVLEFTLIILRAYRHKRLLGWLALFVMYWIAFLFNLAMRTFYAGFSI